jgi:tetratricopeptide (TPR) repeat protein
VPIVDGRGHMPPGLLEEIHFARAYAAHLERLQAVYGFEVAVVDYPVLAGEDMSEVLGPDADRALTSPRWALVYWDDVALVYVTREGPHARLAARDGYRHVKPANGPSHVRRLLADKRLAPAVEAELRRALAVQPSSIASLLLGVAAAERGAFDEALAALGRVGEGPWRLEAWQGLGLAYWGKGDMARAVGWLRRVADHDATAGVLYNVGAAYAAAGDDRAAARYLERARLADPGFTPVYPALIEAYRRLGDREGELALGPDFLEAVTRERVDVLLRRGSTLLRAGQSGRRGDVSRAPAVRSGEPRARPAVTRLGRRPPTVATGRAVSGLGHPARC